MILERTNLKNDNYEQEHPTNKNSVKGKYEDNSEKDKSVKSKI